MLSKVRNRATSIVTMLTGFTDPMQTIRVFLDRGGIDPINVRTRDGDYDFQVRGPMDVWCLKETLLDDVYRVNGFMIEPDWTVIDIGAGFGDFSVVAARAASQGRVLAFEPYPGSFQLLVENIERNHTPNALPVRTAVTGVEREVILDFSSLEPLQVKSDASAVSDTSQTVPSKTLESILESEAITRVDLLKLDCEGCEYEVLLESPAAVIERIDRLVMEYHEPILGKTHETLTGFLKRAGFAVESTPNPIHPEDIGYLRASRFSADFA